MVLFVPFERRRGRPTLNFRSGSGAATSEFVTLGLRAAKHCADTFLHRADALAVPSSGGQNSPGVARAGEFLATMVQLQAPPAPDNNDAKSSPALVLRRPCALDDNLLLHHARGGSRHHGHPLPRQSSNASRSSAPAAPQRHDPLARIEIVGTRVTARPATCKVPPGVSCRVEVS